jgi:ABC-type lipoprotein export system ATPase subunit
MKISHGFGLRCHDIIGLFDKTNKISTFIKILPLKLENKNIILITHDMSIANFCDKKYKMDNYNLIDV